MYIISTKAAETSFHAIGENANLIIVEQLWYILQIVLQIDVIGIFHWYVRIF